MADVVGVVFHPGSKTYHFDPAGLELSLGDRVVVQTIHGTELGRVVEAPHAVPDSEISVPLKRVLRSATKEDFATQMGKEASRKESMQICRELIATHDLDMKLVDAEMSFGGDKITFSFYSDERVDFRALVADLARTLKMRIELRQIGAREEARMIGGLGLCGRHLCCSLFPGDDEPVSIRMAKEQSLPLNPMKISGLCGRLMCCLKYEQEQYVAFRKESPAKGTKVLQEGEPGEEDSQGVVIGYNVIQEALTVRFENGVISDVRLKTCCMDEDGCLRCKREQESKAVILSELSFSDSPSKELWDGIDEFHDEDDATEADVEDFAEADEASKAAGKPRRRGRSKRGGRTRKPNKTYDAKESNESGGSKYKQQKNAYVDDGETEEATPSARGPRVRARRRRLNNREVTNSSSANSQANSDTTKPANEVRNEARKPRRRRPKHRGGDSDSNE